MFGPARTTALSATEYRLLIAALELEWRRLGVEAAQHRDRYDPPAWAEATLKRRHLGALQSRLKHEMRELPEETEQDRQSQMDRLRRTARRIPRSKANAEAHHADVLKRHEAAEAPKEPYWRIIERAAAQKA